MNTAETPNNGNNSTNNENNGDHVEVNFSKALGSLYESLTDEQKEHLGAVAENDSRARATLASMESADLGAMLEASDEATTEHYKNLIDSMMARGIFEKPPVQAPNSPTTTNQLPVVASQELVPVSQELVPVSQVQQGEPVQKRGLFKRAKDWAASYGYSPFIWMATRSSKFEERYRTASPEERKKMERKANIIGSIGTVAVAAAAAGIYYLTKSVDVSGITDGNTSGGGQSNAPGAIDDPRRYNLPKAGEGQGIVSEQQLDHYFSAPNTSEMADKLHHPNDLSPGNPALANFDKNGAVQNLHEMFRGNANITAMWAAQVGIPGAPEMPPLDVLQNDPSAVIAFNEQVNDWADVLKNDVRLRADVTQQIVDMLNEGSLGNRVTLNPGYLSTGSHNMAGGEPIFGANPGETFVDPAVYYEGATATEWHINGKTILVQEGCNQIAGQAPVYETPSVNTSWQPQGGSQPTNPGTSQGYENTPSSNTPGGSTPGGETPNGETPGGGSETPDDGKQGRNPGSFPDLGAGEETDEVKVETEVSESTGRPVGGGRTEEVHTDRVTNEAGTQQNGDAQNTNATRESQDTSSNSESGSGVGTGDGSGGTTSSDYGRSR